jgi:hypothetical protein
MLVAMRGGPPVAADRRSVAMVGKPPVAAGRHPARAAGVAVAAR